MHCGQDLHFCEADRAAVREITSGSVNFEVHRKKYRPKFGSDRIDPVGACCGDISASVCFSDRNTNVCCRRYEYGHQACHFRRDDNE